MYNSVAIYYKWGDTRVDRCKGTRDLTVDEMTRFRLIEELFREHCLKWGYQEIRTPTIEYLHLFTSVGTLTPGMLSKVYSFLDWDGWSGERVVLKPDGTIPVARYYTEYMADKEMARLFYVTKVFIFEPTGKESRERWQCGVELIGVSSSLADTELLLLAREVLSGLGLKNMELRLSHAGLIRTILAGLGLSPGEQAKMFDRILDGDLAALAELKKTHPGSGKALASLLESAGKSAGFLKNLKAQFVNHLPELGAPLDDFISTVSLLDELGYDYVIDIASGRGFEYYTGLIFQFFIGDEKIGAGGRYDALISLVGGEDVPASGFALYLDPLIKMISPVAVTQSQLRKTLVRVSPGVAREGISLLDEMHAAGYPAELGLGDNSPASYRWTINVRDGSPRFILTDAARQKSLEVETAVEILKIIGAESDNKDSST